MIQSPPKYFFNNIQFNPSYYSTSSVSQLDLSKKINRGGDEMTGNLSLGNKYINNLATPLTALQAVNKTYCDSAIATAGGSFLPLLGGSMSGNINMNSNNLTNVSYVSNPTQLNFQIGTNLPLIIQSNQSSIAVPLIFNLVSGSVGINLNGSNINYCGSIHGYNNTNLILSYYNGVVVSPKISLTSGRALITDGLKISNIGIDMSGNSITNIPNGVADGDGINKKQMDDADNLRLKLDGSTPMTADLNMGTKMVSNIGTAIPTSNQAVAKAHLTSVLGSYLPLAGGTMTGNIIMNNNKILACNSIAGNLNTNLVLNYLSGTTTILPKISLTSGTEP